MSYVTSLSSEADVDRKKLQDMYVESEAKGLGDEIISSVYDVTDCGECCPSSVGKPCPNCVCCTDAKYCLFL